MNKWAVPRFTIAAPQAETVPDKASWTQSSFLQENRCMVGRTASHHASPQAESAFDEVDWT